MKLVNFIWSLVLRTRYIILFIIFFLYFTKPSVVDFRNYWLTTNTYNLDPSSLKTTYSSKIGSRFIYDLYQTKYIVNDSYRLSPIYIGILGNFFVRPNLPSFFYIFSSDLSDDRLRYIKAHPDE